MGVFMMDNMAVHVLECFDSSAVKAWRAVLVVFLVTMISYVCTSKLRNRGMPPGPFPWPVFGNLFSVGKGGHLSLARLANRYGNIMCVYLGNIRTIVVSDAKMAKELFCVSDAQFASRPIHSLMCTTPKYLNQVEHDCDEAASHYTPKVRELRQIMKTELFAPQKLDTTANARKEEVARMVEGIESFVRAGQPVNF
jgi:geraniol 8-hydroxylase